LKNNELPASECLKDTVNRMLPYWHNTITPSIKAGARWSFQRMATACAP